MSFRNEDKFRFEKKKSFDLIYWLKSLKSKKKYISRKVCSLYFDNNNLQMYLDSIEGITPRKKIRIRVYNEDNFYKDNLDANLEKKISSVEGRFKTTNKIKNVNNFLKYGFYDNFYGNCYPKIKISYNRSYYQFENYRITIDENISYEKFHKLFNNTNVAYDDYNVFEIKYNEKNESISNLQNDFPFERSRFSKYCRAVELTLSNNKKLYL
tara:strand:- start:2036 stop:2668 length:633 start_codon:yes stop_codon:yes gene_type:complete